MQQPSEALWKREMRWILWRLAILFCLDNIRLSADALTSSESVEEPLDSNDYDASAVVENPRLAACKRDPTWQHVDYKECQSLMGWTPRDKWWTSDKQQMERWLGVHQVALRECIDTSMEQAKDFYQINGCQGDKLETACQVDAPTTVAKYSRLGQGPILVIENLLSEQEAHSVEVLAECMQKLLPKEEPFYEVRAFGTEDRYVEDNLYQGLGGNYCMFLQGLLQVYLPGVVASIFHGISMAFEDLSWEKLGMPRPSSLGLRTAEFLKYKTSGMLGNHRDTGSVYTVSMALSDPDDFDGGYFHLRTADALFKVDRRSAIVFFSESEHSVTQVSDGERKVFVVEIWEEDDAPVGLPRPTFEEMLNYKESRRESVSTKIINKE